MRAVALFVGLCLCACTREAQVGIEMRPVAGGLERAFASSGDPGLLVEVARQVSGAYEAADPARAKAVFEGRLPGEFGGTGFTRSFESELGRAWIYSERLQAGFSVWETVSSTVE